MHLNNSTLAKLATFLKVSERALALAVQNVCHASSRFAVTVADPFGLALASALPVPPAVLHL